MSLYDLHEAKLNDMEGQGFAYSEKTVYGKAYKGVFFAENGEDLESLEEKEKDATFTGILYDRSRERETGPLLRVRLLWFGPSATPLRTDLPRGSCARCLA